MKSGSWSDLSGSVEEISKRVLVGEKVTSPFIMLALNDNASLHKQASEIFARNKYPENPILGPIPKHPKKEKIRIGYFSADFKNHAVSILTAELFELHDKDRFEIIAFSFGVDDKSPIRSRLSQAFSQFIDVRGMSDLDIAKLSRELRVDIAVDLSGYTSDNRTGIFSYRAAPIQVNWLGYPGTIGANFMDYIVADKTIIPAQSEQFYTEKVVSLPDTYIVDDSKRLASSRVFTRAELGLPENVFVFCCFNNDYKFNPQVLDAWARILLQVKNSVVWISENNQSFKGNITAEFNQRGIDSSRVIFAQRQDLMADHLARYALADLFLDTCPYNAHTTALDSLKAGIPVLTLMGQSFASRVAASLLRAVGLPELIANTWEEYEALAIELAMSPQKLAQMKSRLADNRMTAPLFNTPLFTKNLETAYSKMYERYQADLPVDHISI
jgi:predicted O-linked N-acetylglucosamine transferase (SPINDLY family)